MFGNKQKGVTNMEDPLDPLDYDKAGKKLLRQQQRGILENFYSRHSAPATQRVNDALPGPNYILLCRYSGHHAHAVIRQSQL